MIVENVIENLDGSMDCILTFTEEEKEMLLRFAFTTVLKKTIEEGELYTPDKPIDDNQMSFVFEEVL